MEKTDIKYFLEEVSSSLSENVERCIEDNTELMSKLTMDLNLLDYWVQSKINLNTEVLLEEVNYDLFSAIYIAAMGMYRNAYINLRSALELGISFFYFTDNNYNFLLWKNNEFDMKWAILKKEIISEKYLSLFVGDLNLDLDNLINKVEDIYSECSEYVHGKYKYMHTIYDQEISYDKEEFKKWAHEFLEVIKILNCFLAIRFNEKLTNESFEDDKFMLIKKMLKSYNLKEVI